jgi:hypothetical protein
LTCIYITSQIKQHNPSKNIKNIEPNQSSAEKRINDLQDAKSQLMAALDNEVPEAQRTSISDCIQKMMASINGINEYIPKIVSECKANAQKETIEWKSKYEIINKENEILKSENEKCREIIQKQAYETKELNKIIEKISKSNSGQEDKLSRLEGISKRQEIMIQMLQKGMASHEMKPALESKENMPVSLKDELDIRIKDSVIKSNDKRNDGILAKQSSAYKAKADSLKNQIKSLDDDIDGLRKNLLSVLSNQK